MTEEYRSRRERARDLLEYLFSGGFTVAGVSEDGKVAFSAPEEPWPPPESLRGAIGDLQSELLEAVQERIARLIVETKFRAWQDEYTDEESALEQVRETWPKHATLAAAIDAHPLGRQVFAATRELAEITGVWEAARTILPALERGTEWGPRTAEACAMGLRDHWIAQGHERPAEGGAWDELGRILTLPSLWPSIGRPPETEPATTVS